MLYHVSEEPGITSFEPRRKSSNEPAVVWAVHADRLRNYLLPRDCPRVTYFADEQTTPADVERFLGGSSVVVAFESVWLDRVRQARLYLYELPDDGFSCVDETAGYYQSRDAVIPVGVEVVDDCLGALASRRVEIRIMPTLWPLRDAVVESTLGFSIIRMKNAQSRNQAQSAKHGGTEPWHRDVPIRRLSGQSISLPVQQGPRPRRCRDQDRWCCFRSVDRQR